MSLSQSLSDPVEPSAIVAAAQWLQGTLLGTIATTVAIIAIAALGLMMLTGRIDVRRGVTAVVGCFILFGAPSISAGLRGLATDDGGPNVARAYTIQPNPPPTSVVRADARPPYDPYAGAAVPSN